MPQLPQIEFRNVTKYHLDQELFTEFGTPHVKGQAATIACTFCHTVGRELRVCQRCKSARYCSKECQRKNWPKHKQLCISCDHPNPFKLFKILTTNPMTMGLLETAIILDLDLANGSDAKRGVGFEYPFAVKVDVGIEPCNRDTFIKLVFTDDPVPDTIEGIVHIHKVTCRIPGPNISVTDLENWRRGRKRADDIGLGEIPVGTVDFFLNGLGPFTMVGRPVHPAMARELMEEGERIFVWN